MYYASMAIAIIGLTVYQLIMKSAPRGVNPWWLLALAYLVAALICIPAGYLWKRTIAPDETAPGISHLTAASLIALAVILIEIGYLLVYRANWPMSLAPVVAQTFTIALLLVTGILFFKESFSFTKASGLALALAGVFLITFKSTPASP